MNTDNCKHDLETRDAYFPKLKKKGKITFCRKEGCKYCIKEVSK
jgi:hypothetical protein